MDNRAGTGLTTGMTTVVITGFMGTGKTSVGRALADRLRVAFVDTDSLIEKSEGRSVTEIFDDRGETYFRTVERQAIAAALATPGAVVATGGGAVMDPDNVAALRKAAPLVCLSARPDVIEARTRAQGGTRPLLSGADLEQHIAVLLAQRAEAYARADRQIDTSDRNLEDLVDEIAAFLDTKNS